MHPSHRFSSVAADGTKRKRIGALFEVYYASLCRFASSYLHDAQGAEDVVQEVFLRVWEQRRTRTLRHARAYLFRAVRNRALNECKRRSTAQCSEHDLSTIADLAPSRPDDKTTREEVREAIRKAANHLSSRQREVFVLNCIEGFTHAEIAEVLDLSVKTVSTHMVRAKRALRGRLKKHR